MRHHIAHPRDFLDPGLDHRHEAIVVHFHPELVEEGEQLRRLRRRVDEEQNASVFVPKIAQHFHLAIGEIVLRSGDHHDFHLGGNGRHFEQIQLLELNVFVFDKRLQTETGLSPLSGGSLCPRT